MFPDHIERTVQLLFFSTLVAHKIDVLNLSLSAILLWLAFGGGGGWADLIQYNAIYLFIELPNLPS